MLAGDYIYIYDLSVKKKKLFKILILISKHKKILTFFIFVSDR